MTKATTHRRAWAFGWLAGLALLSGAVLLTNLTVPVGNAGAGPVDVLLVLGTPARSNGGPTQSEWWRVSEAAREYHAGVATHILFSGGAAANAFVEADTMATLALQMGVPAAAIVEERESRTTLENIRNSQVILDAHGWRRVEIISHAAHLRRASVLLARTHLTWRVHAAPTPGRPRLVVAYSVVREALGTAILRWFGTGAEPFLHAVSRSVSKAVKLLRGML